MRALTLGKAADQGALFVGSLVVARSIGPAAFAPFGLLLVLNSVSVQLSDLGLGFAIHGSPLERPVPGRSLGSMRRVGLLVAVAGAGVAVATGLVLPAVVGAVWAVSGEGYVRKALTTRAGAAPVVLRAEATGAVCFLLGSAGVVVFHATWLFGVGLLVKHLAEVALLPRTWTVDPTASLSSSREWLGQAVTFVGSNVDYLVVGLALSSASFSVYVMAFRMVSALPALVAHALTQDTFVGLADPSAGLSVASVHDRMVRRVAPIAVLGIGVGVAAASGGRLVLGSSWSQLIGVSVVLAVAIPFRLLLGPSVALAIAEGRATLVIGTELLRLVLTAACVAVGAESGLLGAAVGSVTATAIGVLLLFHLVRPAGAVRSVEPAQASRSYNAQSQ